MLLDVPYFKQDTGYSCGAASLQMVLAHHGIRVSERELMERLGTDDEYGTHHEPIIREVTGRGLYCYVTKEATLEELLMYLDRALPSLVHYIEPSEDAHHYSVMVGYDAHHVILHDPWNGRGFTLVRREFEERWHDAHGVFPHWFLTASPEDLQVGRQYRPAA
jgi:predicted double-glycine peptidase